MPRPKSQHVIAVKAALVAKLRSGFVHPGARFYSTRAVAQRFTVSFQTAHRLLAELEQEGLLQRRAASGSYVPGRRQTLQGVQLIFHRRARRKASFGSHLLEQLEVRLRERGIASVCSWPQAAAAPRLRVDYFPVIWECRAAAHAAGAARRFALCLNDHPPAGLSGSYVDAVTTDDFSGGACAAELLKARTGTKKGFVVLGGPATDRRNEQRIAGFRAHVDAARVVTAGSWFVEAGREHAADVLRRNPTGIFTCNDRLAEAVLQHCRTHGRPVPPLVGFDNAPIAERLRLTTVGIPWASMVEHAIELITARLAGSSAPARLVSLAHEPVIRLTC